MNIHHPHMRAIGLLTLTIIFFGSALWVYAQTENEVIRACVRPDGVMTFLTSTSPTTNCKYLLKWNVQGPPGPIGPQGPIGSQGTPGSQLRLRDANNQDLGILIDRGVSVGNPLYTSSVGYRVFTPQGYFIEINDFLQQGQVVISLDSYAFNLYFDNQNCSGLTYAPVAAFSLQSVIRKTTRYFINSLPLTPTNTTLLSTLSNTTCSNIPSEATTTAYLLSEISNPFPQAPVSPLQVVSQ